MIENLLKELFLLTEKEVTAYMALSENNNSSVSLIAKAAGLPRNTVRGVLDKLIAIGIVFKTKNRNVFLYSIESKNKIIENLQKKRELFSHEIEYKIDYLNKKGGLIDGKFTDSTKPKLFFYDGYSGIKKIYEDTLNAKSMIRSWGSFDENSKILPRYFQSYYARRAKRAIKIRSIHPDSKFARIHMKRNKQELREAFLIPQEKFKISPEIQVYDNKVNIVSWRERVGIIIESSEIADAVISIFELYWNDRKKNNS